MSESGGGRSSVGKLLSILLIVGLIGLGIYLLIRGNPGAPAAPVGSAVTAAAASAPAPSAANEDAGAPPALAETKFDVPRLPPPATYVPKGDTIDVELSEYPGYAGIIAANGGLEPSEQSFSFKKHGVKLRIRFGEAEDMDDVANGSLAAAATTADVLAVYGRNINAIVPVQIGFSRGADGIVVRDEISSTPPSSSFASSRRRQGCASTPSRISRRPPIPSVSTSYSPRTPSKRPSSSCMTSGATAVSWPAA